jgi:hypothetical protein
MSTRERVESFAIALGLSAISGLALAALIGAVLTGTIDGGARGPDLIALAERPLAFWISIAVHSVVAGSAAAAAVAFWRKSIAAH